MEKEYRVEFFDKNGDETRCLVVMADNDETAEIKACEEADKRHWPASFKVCDTMALDGSDT